MSSEYVNNCSALKYFESLEEFIREQADRNTTRAFRMLDRSGRDQPGSIVGPVMSFLEDVEAPLKAVSTLEAVDEIIEQQEILHRAIGNRCVCPLLYDEDDEDKELALCSNPVLASLAQEGGTLGYRVQSVWRDII